MPIEIRELVIKMTVDNPDQKSSGNANEIETDDSIEGTREEIIRECTDRILNQLNNNKER
jgi:hypothetical protein